MSLIFEVLCLWITWLSLPIKILDDSDTYFIYFFFWFVISWSSLSLLSSLSISISMKFFSQWAIWYFISGVIKEFFIKILISLKLFNIFTISSSFSIRFLPSFKSLKSFFFLCQSLCGIKKLKQESEIKSSVFSQNFILICLCFWTSSIKFKSFSYGVFSIHLFNFLLLFWGRKNLGSSILAININFKVCISKLCADIGKIKMPKVTTIISIIPPMSAIKSKRPYNFLSWKN